MLQSFLRSSGRGLLTKPYLKTSFSSIASFSASSAEPNVLIYENKQDQKQKESDILRPEVRKTNQPPLDVELANLPTLKPASQLQPPTTEVSTLPNGLRVISEENFGQASTIGVFIDAGSRFEDDSTNGLTHLMEHVCFKSTANRSHGDLVREMEDIGAVPTAMCGREQIIYTVDLLRDNIEKGVDILSDCILRPTLIPEEIDMIKNILAIQNEQLGENPQSLIQERVHEAAYGSSSGLGRPIYCPVDKIDALSVDGVRAYMDKFFVASRMVLAGSGVEHQRLVDVARKHFSDLPTGILTKPDQAIYKGGLCEIPSSDAQYSSLAIAFETGGWHDDDLIAVCVLHTLLGGGDSFSAGGPGKGMYSRLYTSVLNRYGWVESASAFTSMHNDHGLLGIYGACLPNFTSNLVALLCNQLILLTKEPVSDIELSRAKNQLKSTVLMNLESRMILYEDIGRQLLTYGKRESPDVICSKIDAITAEDLRMVVNKALSKPPSLVYHGDVLGKNKRNSAYFPAYSDVANALQQGLA